MKKSVKRFLIGAGITAVVGKLAYDVYKRAQFSEEVTPDTITVPEPKAPSADTGSPQDYVERRREIIKARAVGTQGTKGQIETETAEAKTDEPLAEDNAAEAFEDTESAETESAEEETAQANTNE